MGFPAVTGLDEVKSLLQSRLLWYWDTKEAEQGRGVQRRDRENKFEWNKKDKTLKETSEFMSIKVYLNGESVKLSVVENITHLGSCTEQSWRQCLQADEELSVVSRTVPLYIGLFPESPDPSAQKANAKTSAITIWQVFLNQRK